MVKNLSVKPLLQHCYACTSQSIAEAVVRKLKSEVFSTIVLSTTERLPFSRFEMMKAIQNTGS
jgi:hypothetical protein